MNGLGMMGMAIGVGAALRMAVAGLRMWEAKIAKDRRRMACREFFRELSTFL